MTKRGGPRNWQGMNWIRQEKRLAIYLRDGLACTYCGDAVENGAILSLDHVRPHSKGGTNKADNLVTCCKRCNSARGNRPVAKFARAVAEYLDDGTAAREIVNRVRAYQRRDMKAPLAEAKRLIARRGSCAAAIENAGS